MKMTTASFHNNTHEITLNTADEIYIVDNNTKEAVRIKNYDEFIAISSVLAQLEMEFRTRRHRDSMTTSDALAREAMAQTRCCGGLGIAHPKETDNEKYV